MSSSSNFIVLAVDNSETDIELLLEEVGDVFEMRVALSGEAALESVVAEKPDLILLDVIMPGMDGYEVCRRLKANSNSHDIPVIFLTGMDDEKNEVLGLSLGAVDYITKPISAALMKARVKNHLELKRHRDHLEELVAERTRELARTQEITIYCLASLVEARDPETGGHILRTQRYVRELARKLQEFGLHRDYLDDKTIELLFKSAPLHDIGKVGVEDRILMKPGKLEVDEFEEMKKHTAYGRDALQLAEEEFGDTSFLRYAWEIAYAHHEKWDGSGYPLGISGQDIPVSGRLMAIADVYDALISRRVYKPPFSHRDAVRIIGEGMGSHFDPEMVEAFMTIEDDFKRIALEFSDSVEEKASLVQ